MAECATLPLSWRFAARVQDLAIGIETPADARNPNAITWAKPEGSRAVDRPEVRHDLLTVRLEKRRQHDFLAEHGRIVIDREAGPLGGDFKQHAIRLRHIYLQRFSPGVPASRTMAAQTEDVTTRASQDRTGDRSVTLSSGPRHVTIRSETRNQRDEGAQVFIGKLVVPRRPAGPADR